MDIADRCARLAASGMFGGLERAMLDRLAAASRALVFEAGSTMFQEGDEADGIHCIASGLVRIHLAHEDGRELTLNLLERGDVIGEIALLDGLPRTAGATAIERTETVFLDRASFTAMLDASPQLARHVILVLCERLRRNTDQLNQSAFLDLRHRLLNLFRELAVGHGEVRGDRSVVTPKLTQTEIAQMLGVARESVNKQIAALVRDGAVSLDAGRIVLHRVEAPPAR